VIAVRAVRADRDADERSIAQRAQRAVRRRCAIIAAARDRDVRRVMRTIHDRRSSIASRTLVAHARQRQW